MENHINAETAGTVAGDPRRGRRLRRHRRRPRRSSTNPDVPTVGRALARDRSCAELGAMSRSRSSSSTRSPREPFARQSGRPSCCSSRRHADDEWMQTVAAEMNHSETAFVRPRADGAFDLRWFTPEVEVDLCGHATLASAHVLCETGPARARRDGPVPHPQRRARARSTPARDGITLDFPVAEPVPTPADGPSSSTRSGSRRPRSLAHRPASSSCCVVDRRRDRARRSRPTSPSCARSPTCAACTSPRPATTGYDIVSRCFAPRVGIDEDPVTGSMHCVLVAVLVRPRLGHRRAARVPGVGARRRDARSLRKGDRALLTGQRDDGARRASYPREPCSRCQASCASRPSRSDTSRLPTEQLARAVDRAAVAERVAGLARLLVDLHRRAGELADERDQLRERDLAAAREVARTCRARRRASAASEIAAHDVGDVRELADLRAVAVARERRAVDRGFAQPVDRHVGPLARTEHGEVAQRHRGDAPVLRVQPAEVLGRELRDAVGAERLGQVGLRRSGSAAGCRTPTTTTRTRRAPRAAPRRTASSSRCVASTLWPT